MRYIPIVAAMLAISGVTMLDAVPVTAQGKPGGVGGQGIPSGPTGGVGGPHGPGNLTDGGNPAEMMFQMFDTNRDGLVTKQEFFDPHEQRFGATDTNKDGRLTAEEFKTMAGPPPGPGVPLQQRR